MTHFPVFYNYHPRKSSGKYPKNKQQTNPGGLLFPIQNTKKAISIEHAPDHGENEEHGEHAPRVL
jgi:hypothetical protein